MISFHREPRWSDIGHAGAMGYGRTETRKTKSDTDEGTVVTLLPQSLLVRSGQLVTLAATFATLGCAAQRGRQETRDFYASTDMAAYIVRAPVISEPLTMQDALDYADRYNIHVWIAAKERDFQKELATQSLLKMLPSMIAGAETKERSTFDASSSQSLASGEESLEASLSSGKQNDTWNVSATWNLLDFGISFLRARQQKNRVGIAEERERRVRQNLALEVTQAYWRAVTARESAAEAEHIREEIAASIEKVERQIVDRTLSEIDGLKSEATLLSQQEGIRQYKRNYSTARAELGALMGLPPGARFTLAEVDLDQGAPLVEFDIAALECETLRSRPELFEKDLEEAISRDEVHVALAQMFPSLSLFWRYDNDRNRFLVFNDWYTAGLRASWDLLAIPQKMKQREAVKLRSELITQQRIALAVGIVTQLHLALIDYEEAIERREITWTIAQKRRALLVAVESAADEGKSHDGETLDHRMTYLKARAKYLAAHANLMASHARLLNTIGRNLTHGGSERVADDTASLDAMPSTEHVEWSPRFATPQEL